ncbi:MAG: class I SAM-dependent methyltransferase family protein [Nanoarchaeota archaeon]|nr:class I SAM-dependent methyltransferase family protein [Nanoarchaeota archaeon]
MGLVVKVKVEEAEKVRNYLKGKGWLDTDYKIEKESNFIFIPVTEKLKKYKVMERKLKKTKREKTIVEMLKGKLNSSELNLLPRTFEEVGDILVLELERGLEKKKKVIGGAYLKKYKQIKTVLKKKVEHSGEYRLRKLEWLAGEKKKETLYKENGVSLKVNLEKVYFSSKSAGERLRIAKLVKDGEEVLVMFSGCAPFPLVIARNSSVKEVVGVELNPDGHKSGEENVKLNRLWGRVKLYQGDVRKVVPKLKRKFDRVVMPLPKTGEKFLDVALKVVKDKGMVHLYAFLGEENFDSDRKKVLGICKKLGKKCRVVDFRKCGAFAPGVFRVVYDLRIG